MGNNGRVTTTDKRELDQVTICISINDIEKSKQIFESLSQEDEVKMPLQEAFFSPAYGIVTDKFGVTFQIYTEGNNK